MERSEETRCDGCGLEIQGGTTACGEIFQQFLERDFSNPAYYRYHRMLVDTYSLQHPARYCVSAKSLAAHLAGLCALLEGDESRAVGSQALQKWLDGKRLLVKPEIPANRGQITIADVRASEGHEAYDVAVERWARATWEAYSSLHSVARQWIQDAVSEAAK